MHGNTITITIALLIAMKLYSRIGNSAAMRSVVHNVRSHCKHIQTAWGPGAVSEEYPKNNKIVHHTKKKLSNSYCYWIQFVFKLCIYFNHDKVVNGETTKQRCVLCRWCGWNFRKRKQSTLFFNGKNQRHTVAYSIFYRSCELKRIVTNHSNHTFTLQPHIESGHIHTMQWF